MKIEIKNKKELIRVKEEEKKELETLKMKLVKEVFKCVDVCENCHYKIHSEEGGINGQYVIINRRRHSYIQNLLGSANRSSMG